MICRSHSTMNSNMLIMVVLNNFYVREKNLFFVRLFISVTLCLFDLQQLQRDQWHSSIIDMPNWWITLTFYLLSYNLPHLFSFCRDQSYCVVRLNGNSFYACLIVKCSFQIFFFFLRLWALVLRKKKVLTNWNQWPFNQIMII